MPYPAKMVSALTGVSAHQLRRLRYRGVVAPSRGRDGEYLYSFDDLLVLRIFAKLRPYISAQKIDKAFFGFQKLISSEGQDTLGAHRFGTDGESIFVDATDSAVDLVKRPGQGTVFTFDEMIEEFVNWRGERVPNLLHPRRHLEIDPGRLGGWSTVKGTRIPFDTIAALRLDDDMSMDDISYYYPSVTVQAVEDSVDFSRTMQRLAV